MAHRLANATSPYLRQHRDNPVDWWQWGNDAFDEARRTGKPVLLSVGYSACHWCHVMAHESFEDPETAELMNRLFINIKVDREERPDVDAIYMDAIQAMTGRGGWPMTVFLTPDALPFYGGTYWPRDAFQRLLSAVDDAWRNRRDELQQNIDALHEVVSRTARIEPADDFDARDVLRMALDTLAKSFDRSWGGFGHAPKFPSTFAIDLALRAHIERGDSLTGEIVLTSLDAMASGGMWDHLGGGFARYSVDEKWLVPHFEKMLYDQALLLRVYLHAWKVMGHDRHLQVATEIIEYVMGDLTDPLGGFYSAEDADSLTPEGHSEEGAFYTWTPEEVRAVLGDDADAALAWWGITAEGNFEGRSIPTRLHHRGDIVRSPLIERCRTTLEMARRQRPRPGLDDKVLTEWNAMFLSSLCEAAAATGHPDWRAAAIANGRFLVDELRDSNGQWRRSWQRDTATTTGNTALAHDIAHVIDAMTRLYELTADHEWLRVAIAAADDLIDRFWDDVHGGFFTVARDAEQLIARQKDLMDNATPSSNSTAAVALLRLGALTGRDDLTGYAHRTLALLARVVPSAPNAFCHAMNAFHMVADGITEVVIPGDSPHLVAEYRSKWRPNSVLAAGDPFDGGLFEGREPSMAYVCRDRVCQLPVSDVTALREQLAQHSFG